MQKLYLTPQQAKSLADDLVEYTAMTDSSDRTLFKGFRINFGDMLAHEPRPDQGLEITPLPEFLEIPADEIQP